jgi:alpha-beta hydrolase superfamily lysophospholipase
LKEDTLAFVADTLGRHPKAKFMMCGHSMGGALCLILSNQLRDMYPTRFRGLLLLSPCVTFHERDIPSSCDRNVISCLTSRCFMSCCGSFAGGPSIVTATDFGASNLSEIQYYDNASVLKRDDRSNLVPHPANYNGKLIISTVQSLLNLQVLVHSSIASLKSPFLVAQGSLDATVDPVGAEKVFECSLEVEIKAKKIVRVVGGSHQLLSEDLTIAEPLLEKLCAFAIENLRT